MIDLTWEGLALCVSTARPIVNLYGDGVDNIELNECVAIGEVGIVVPSPDSTTSFIYVSRGTRLGCAHQLGFDELVVVCPSSQTISGRFEVGDSFAKSEE